MSIDPCFADISAHLSSPQLLTAPAHIQAEGCQAVCFQGPDYQGQPSEVFAGSAYLITQM